MAELRWIQTSLIVTLLLQVPGGVKAEELVYVRPGDEAVLSCGDISDHHVKCNDKNWTSVMLFLSSKELVVRGQTQSDRVRLTENCSLVLKNVSREDTSLYGCTQDDTSGQPRPLSVMLLYVLTNGEELVAVTSGGKVTLTCGDVRDRQGKCNGTNWAFRESVSSSSVDLVVRGQTQSDRVRTTENCALVLKNVSRQDTGLYSCRQDDTSGQERPLSVFDLSVIPTNGMSLVNVRDGIEVTLTCGDIRGRQGKCRDTHWSVRFGKSVSSPTVDLVVRGQTQSDRVRTTENCAMVLKNVSREDAGQYSCRQDTSGRQLPLSVVDLSVGNTFSAHSGAAATQVQRVEEEDEDEGPVHYENSVRLH